MALRHEQERRERFREIVSCAASQDKVGDAEPCVLDKGSNYFPGVEDEIRKHQFSYNAVPPRGETWLTKSSNNSYRHRLKKRNIDLIIV